MKPLSRCTALIALLALLVAACDSGVTPDTADGVDALVAPTKVYICHVGSTFGPNGETYLDDPTCEADCETAGGTEEEIAACQAACPDAGKVDLLYVPENSNHFGNPSHCFDFGTDDDDLGTGKKCDYDPTSDPTAEDAKEDDDGDGLDNACEFEFEVDDPDCPVLESTICSGELFGNYSSEHGPNTKVQKVLDMNGSCPAVEAQAYGNYVADVCANTCPGVDEVGELGDPVCFDGTCPTGANPPAENFQVSCEVTAIAP